MSENGASSRLSKFRRVKAASDGVGDGESPDDLIEEDAAMWQGLADAGAKLAIAVEAVVEGGGLVDRLLVVDSTASLVRAVIAVDEAQTRLLKSIDENVKLLRDGPFKTGRTYLEQAHRVSSDPERSVEYLKKAQDKFYEARELVAEPTDRAIVEMHLGITGILLGNPDDAQHWLAKAYEDSVIEAYQLADLTGNTKVRKGKGLAQAATAYLTLGASAAYLAGKKIKNSRSNTRAQTGLRELLPVVACISALHRVSEGSSDDYPALELVKLDDNTYELTAVGVDSVESP